jgi:hypothetical protein
MTDVSSCLPVVFLVLPMTRQSALCISDVIRKYVASKVASNVASNCWQHPCQSFGCQSQAPYGLWLLLLQISLGALPLQPGYQHIPFLHSKGSHDRVKSVTHLVVTDLSHARGRSLALAAVDYLMDSDFDNADDGRIGLILAPKAEASTLDAAVQLLCKVGVSSHSSAASMHMGVSSHSDAASVLGGCKESQQCKS